MSAQIINLDSRREPQKPEHCPHCKSRNIAEIVYGYPSDELLHSNDDNVIVGGCVVDVDSPNWRCKQCGRGI